MTTAQWIEQGILYIAFVYSLVMFFRTFPVWFDVLNTAGRLGDQHQGVYDAYFGIIAAEWPNRQNLPEPTRSDFVLAVTTYADMTARARALAKCVQIGGRVKIAAPIIIGMLLSMAYLAVGYLSSGPLAHLVLSAAIAAFVFGGVRNQRIRHALTENSMRLDASVFNEGTERLCLQGLIPEEETNAYELAHSVYLNMNHVEHGLHNALSSMRKI